MPEAYEGLRIVGLVGVSVCCWLWALSLWRWQRLLGSGRYEVGGLARFSARLILHRPSSTAVNGASPTTNSISRTHTPTSFSRTACSLSFSLPRAAK